MKILIVYHSKTGFTKKYASWLAEETGAEVCSLENVKEDSSHTYDIVVFASWLHAGKIQKRKQFDRLNTADAKQLFLVTGAMPPVEKLIEETMAQNFTPDDKVKWFYVQSGLDYDKMGTFDRTLMKGLRAFLKKAKGEDSPFYQGVKSSFDVSSKEALIPIIECLKSF